MNFINDVEQLRSRISNVIEAFYDESADEDEEALVDIDLFDNLEQPGACLAELAADLDAKLAFMALRLLEDFCLNATEADYDLLIQAHHKLHELICDDRIDGEHMSVAIAVCALLTAETNDNADEAHAMELATLLLRALQSRIPEMDDDNEVAISAVEALELVLDAGIDSAPQLLQSISTICEQQQQRPRLVAMLQCATAALSEALGEKNAEKIEGNLQMAMAAQPALAASLIADLAHCGSGQVQLCAQALLAEAQKKAGEPAVCIYGQVQDIELSQCDYLGDQSLRVFYRNDDQDCVAEFNLNVRNGLAQCQLLSGEEELEELEDLAEEGLCSAPLQLEEARDFIAHALHLRQQSGQYLPASYLLIAPLLGVPALTPASREALLGAYASSAPPTPAPTSLELLPPYSELLLLPSLDQEVPENFADFKSFVLDTQLSHLQELLAANLEVEALAGRANQDLNQHAAELYKLLEKQQNISRNSFLEAVVKQSLQALPTLHD